MLSFPVVENAITVVRLCSLSDRHMYLTLPRDWMWSRNRFHLLPIVHRLSCTYASLGGAGPVCDVWARTRHRAGLCVLHTLLEQYVTPATVAHYALECTPDLCKHPVTAKSKDQLKKVALATLKEYASAYQISVNNVVEKDELIDRLVSARVSKAESHAV